MTAAIARQSRKLVHISNLFFHEGQAELALRLTERTGLDRAFFCNSGTEAWEAAMKLARAYAGAAAERRPHHRNQVSGASKTASTGARWARSPRPIRRSTASPSQPLVPGVEFVRFNDVEDLRASFSNEVCAVLIEPVQGEGGIRPVSQEFFAAARELTNSTGALLIADEIQSGLGRTGKWFAYQQYRHSAGRNHAGQATGRRPAPGSNAVDRGGGARNSRRPAWHDLRRRTAGLRGGHRGN